MHSVLLWRYATASAAVHNNEHCLGYNKQLQQKDVVLLDWKRQLNAAAKTTRPLSSPLPFVEKKWGL